MDMTTKVRWTAVAILLAALTVGVVWMNRGADPVPPPRIPDAPPADPVQSRQVLKMTPASVDFGEIVLGEKKTLSVQVENTGTRPVLVYQVVLSCPCMTASMESMTIAPGQATKLNLVFSGLPGKRSYRTAASVITDESGPCRYDVVVEGRIQQDFITEPETLTFGVLEKDATATLDAVVRRRDGKAFTIKDIKSPRAEFSFVSEPAPGPKDSAYRITATAKALRPGTVTDTATVVTEEYSADVSPQLTLSVEVRGDFVCTPPIAVVGIGTDGKPSPFETVIGHRSGGKVKVEQVKEGQERTIDFTQEQRGDGSCVLKIQFKDAFPAGAPFGEFLIVVDGQPEPLHLPYRIHAPTGNPTGSP